MLLKFIGRGSAFNIKEGNNSAYIKNNDELFLIDCGESIFEKIISKGILDNIKRVDILITHLDSDHVGSLSSLIYYCYYMKKIVVNVYFPTEDLYELLKLQGHTEGTDYHCYELSYNNLISSAGVNGIYPVKVEHIKTLNCYGYLIYLEEKLIWYSGDCSNISGVISEYKIDEFYQDTCLADYEGNVHTSLRKLCKTIPKDKRVNVYCMHIDSDELIKKAIDEGFNVVEIDKM